MVRFFLSKLDIRGLISNILLYVKLLFLTQSTSPHQSISKGPERLFQKNKMKIVKLMGYGVPNMPLFDDTTYHKDKVEEP